MSITSLGAGNMRNKSMAELIKQVRGHLERGIYDQHELFDLVYHSNRRHYSTIREAIHLAKAGIQ